MIVEGYGKEKGINPYYRFFYKVDLDGSHFTLLTPGDGTHSIELSPDKKYLIDNYSRMDMPVVSQLVKIASPKKPMVIEQSDDSELRALGWRPPVLFSMKAADDSTDLYGIMYLPFDLDTTRRYPIITNVYPGPQDDQIPRAFTVSGFLFFIGAAQCGNQADGCRRYQNIHGAGRPACLAAQQPGNDIQLPSAHKAPVQPANDGQQQADF